jgi:hypothetical protein
VSNLWSPQAAVLIVMPPARPSMPALPPPFPPLPAPPLPGTLPLFVGDPPPQAAIASAPTNMNPALERSPIDMQYHRPRMAHVQVKPLRIRTFGLVLH